MGLIRVSFVSLECMYGKVFCEFDDTWRLNSSGIFPDDEGSKLF
jgi:hypothetical protein